MFISVIIPCFIHFFGSSAINPINLGLFYTMKLLAKTFAGLEEGLADEIKLLGGQNIKIIKRGVQYEGDKRLLYRSNLELRTALRILMPIAQFRARHESAFYNKIKDIDWLKYMDVKQTFSIDPVVRSTYFTHSQYIGLKAKDAIADLFREKMNKRPNVNTATPDVAINIHINEDEVTVSLDASGDSLHRRGYRVDTLEAPMNEVLAAGMVLLSGWKGDCDFVDAMCGSGTILTEAALVAQNTPPQYAHPSSPNNREYFCFKRWKDFDQELFDDILKNTQLHKVEVKHRIMGSDINFQAKRVSERNVEAAFLTDKIELSRKDFFTLIPPSDKGILMMNPPYDDRLKLEDAQDFYKKIGDAMKKNWKGWEVWIISGNLEAVKAIGLKPSKRITLYNGAIECKFLKFEMY